MHKVIKIQKFIFKTNFEYYQSGKISCRCSVLAVNIFLGAFFFALYRYF